MRKAFENLIVCVFLAALLVLPSAYFAEEEDQKSDEKKGEQVQKLDELVVSEKPDNEKLDLQEEIPFELGKVGHPLYVITSEEIEDSGFVDISQVLESLVPGLFSSTRAGRGSYNYASIHGSSRILLLLDGVRINNRIYGNSMENYMNFISVHNIERIEVLESGETSFTAPTRPPASSISSRNKSPKRPAVNSVLRMAPKVTWTPSATPPGPMTATDSWRSEARRAGTVTYPATIRPTGTR